METKIFLLVLSLICPQSFTTSHEIQTTSSAHNIAAWFDMPFGQLQGVSTKTYPLVYKETLGADPCTKVSLLLFPTAVLQETLQKWKRGILKLDFCLSSGFGA